ncbi:MAG TPA: YbaN family protein [Limnochordia bacterium]|nr:YbaN family protein [Limnochordia bacterium]
MQRALKKYLFLSLGTLTLGLGVVGIFIPVLPTTPLLLVTALCYLRSSTALYNWLINHKLLGRYLRAYLEQRIVPRRVKMAALGTLWPSLLLSMFLIPLFPVRLLVALIGLAVSAYILRLREEAAA